MKLKYFSAYILISLFFISCAVTLKTTRIFDESFTANQSAWITPANAGTIIGYNGIPVKWKNKNIFLPEMIQIPAGDTILEWNISSSNGNTGKNILFQFNFLAGKQYAFLASRKEGKNGFLVFTYDLNEKISNMYKDEYLVGFFPFLNS